MMFHPERRGQPHSHHLDWQIVALDGLCLLLFFVPGVIAFAVDFATGAIYLPHHEVHSRYGQNELQRLPLPPDQQSIDDIQQIVSDHSGTAVNLRSEEARVSELATLEQFEQQKKRHEQNKGFGHKLKNFFS